MNTRNKISSSIAGGLAALVMTACSGGGNDPKPVPPAPELICTTTITEENLDNPRQTGIKTYMVGDRMQIGYKTQTSINNKPTGTADPTINKLEIDNSGRAGYDYTIPGGAVNTLEGNINASTPIYTIATPVTLLQRTYVNNTLTGTITTFTGNGPTVNVVPAEEKTYSIQLTGQQIIDLSNVLKNGRDLTDNHQVTYQEIFDFLTQNQSNIQTYIVDFPANTVKMPLKTGGVAGISYTGTSTPRLFEYQTEVVFK